MRMKRSHVERVVVRHERLGDRPADERVHRRRLDLEEPVLVEDGAHRAHDVAARAEDVGHRRVRDEVDVPLPVAQLDVGQPVPLLGQRAVRLRHEAQAPRLDRQLAPLARRQRPLGLDDVGDVDVVEPRVVLAERRLARRAAGSRPVRSRRRRNESPPVDRSATTRPRTWTQRRRPPPRAPSPRRTCPPRRAQRRRDRAHLRRCRASVPPTRGTTSLANGFSPRARTRVGLGTARVDDRLLGRVPFPIGVVRHGPAVVAASLASSSAQGASASSATPPFLSVPPAAASRYASMNGSRSPSSTASTLPFWCEVRRSFTSRYGCRT